ncbi:membrane protein [Streptococcus pneumoniae]|nr:membrane protein [Streptococcus pneumoniae]
MNKAWLFWSVIVLYFFIKFFDKVLDIKLFGSIQIWLDNLPIPIPMKILLTIALVLFLFIVFPYRGKR